MDGIHGKENPAHDESTLVFYLHGRHHTKVELSQLVSPACVPGSKQTCSQIRLNNAMYAELAWFQNHLTLVPTG